MDTIHTPLINAGNGPRVSDDVGQATVPSSDVLPYAAQCRGAAVMTPEDRGHDEAPQSLNQRC
jgi:hypothetical protein